MITSELMESKLEYNDLPVLNTVRTELRFLKRSEAHLAQDYFIRNKEHLESTMPATSASFYELSHWEERLKQNVEEFRKGVSCRFFVLPKNATMVIGTVSFTQIARGCYQGCFLGYGIDALTQGRGLMTEALAAGIEYVFDELNLHKITANYMPCNKPSGRVLEKLGFSRVGVVEQELYLSGKWQDHIQMRLINKHWVADK
jgi:ribosomal-protein-alanine N-acetyltransferase